MLVALSQNKPWEFLAAMSQAWEWTQARKRYYCDTGGYQTFEEYIGEAKRPELKQLVVIFDGKLVSLITVRLTASKTYEIHVTSPPRTQRQVILEALLFVRDSLFQDLQAERIVTSCPVYNGHEHKGSRRLAEACGMLPNGTEWYSEHDDTVLWREYELRRT